MSNFNKQGLAAAPFRSVAEIESFYRNPHHDMTLRSLMLDYAKSHPQAQRRLAYVANAKGLAAKPRDIFLYRYLFAALGGADHWQPQYQKRGTCVGQGGKLGVDVVIAINQIFGGGRFPGRAAVAPLYAGSRVDIGQQPGRWDGSTGFWLVRWMTDFGVVLLRALDLPEDALDRDEDLGVRWTATREGVPRKFEDLARIMPITETYVVESLEEAEIAIDAGCPIVRCSDLIASGQRGRHGVSRVSRQGGHCELVWGKFYINGDRFWNEQNSWSASWGTGPKYPHDMPPGSVNLTDHDFSRILASGDCHALVGIKGLDPIADRELFL